MLMFKDVSTRREFRVEVYCKWRIVGTILREGRYYYYQPKDGSCDRSEMYGSLHSLKWALEG